MKSIPRFISRQQRLLAALVFLSAFAAVAAYLQTLYSPFVIDDTTYISMNKRLATLPPGELWRLLTEPYNDLAEFLPLRDFSYWLDMRLFGLEPAAFRMHNILLYLLCLPLVYGVTVRLWLYFRPAERGEAPSVAAAVTALFALHPSHAEAVVWIAGRKDVLSGLFSLLALWFALAARSERGLSVPYAAWALVALLAAMLSKATAVAVAPVIALFWMLFWRDLPAAERRSSLLLWPAAVLLLAVCVAVIFSAVVTTRVPIYWGLESVTRLFAILGWLSRLAVSPEARHFFYPVMEDRYFYAMIVLGAAVFAFVMIGAVIVWRRRALAWFLPVVFLLLCLPVLQIIPYSPPSLASDRFVFLAVWPVILLLVLLSWRLGPVRRAALLSCIALLWGYQTWERPQDWRSNEAMIEADLRAYPGHYVPAAYKVITQLQKGLSRDAGETAASVSDPVVRNVLAGLINADYRVRSVIASGGDPRSALDALKKVEILLKNPPEQARWNPPVHQTWDACKIMFMTQWDYLVKYFPDDSLLGYYAGLSGLEIGKYKEAAISLSNAVKLPIFPDQVRGAAYYGLGLAFVGYGREEKAEASLRAALEQIPPEPRAYCALEQLYRKTGRDAEASQAASACHKD